MAKMISMIGNNFNLVYSYLQMLQLQDPLGCIVASSSLILLLLSLIKSLCGLK